MGDSAPNRDTLHRNDKKIDFGEDSAGIRQIWSLDRIKPVGERFWLLLFKEGHPWASSVQTYIFPTASTAGWQYPWKAI
jgi:hypothetical protein